MKHHFADLLEREGDYWSMVPNRERYAHRVDNLPAGSPAVTIATVTSEDINWRNILTFPKLEELTLHDSTAEQYAALAQLTNLKRLRITHASPKELSAISRLAKLEELVLEYVSGFSDLSPLCELSHLKSLHLENLRRVSDFSGLSGLAQLRYLRIDGTLDWKQPINDFEFLRGLTRLEILSFGQVITKAPYPALLPALSLKKIKQLGIAHNLLNAEEYALLEVGLPGVEYVDWGPYKRFDKTNGAWFEFTGKGAGRAKCGSPQSEAKCAQCAEKYEQMKASARSMLAQLGLP